MYESYTMQVKYGKKQMYNNSIILIIIRVYRLKKRK